MKITSETIKLAEEKLDHNTLINYGNNLDLTQNLNKSKNK